MTNISIKVANLEIEADVDYFGSNRGTKRLVYTSGCNIYYTGDHYKSFSKMKF